MRAGSGFPMVLVLLAISAALASGCADVVTTHTPNPSRLDLAIAGPLTVTFLDVGQGDATLLSIGNKSVLIDAGPPDAGPGLIRTLETQGVGNISLLVATHPHSDHIGGMDDILKHFPVESVLDGGSLHTSGMYKDFLSTIDRKNIPYMVAARGQVFEIGDGLSLAVLWPAPGARVTPSEEGSTEYLNGGSIVLRADYGQISLLFMGDAGLEEETALLRAGVPVGAEVLKVGHHGSSDASGGGFLAAVGPEVSVVTCGAGNEYGHPHEEVVERLGLLVPLNYRTDRDGTVVIRIDGMRYSVTTGSGNAVVTEARNMAAV